jgi:hypothetical protein
MYNLGALLQDSQPEASRGLVWEGGRNGLVRVIERRLPVCRSWTATTCAVPIVHDLCMTAERQELTFLPPTARSVPGMMFSG